MSAASASARLPTDPSLLNECVSLYNRRLSRPRASCRMRLAAGSLSGGVRLNFRLREPVKVKNTIVLENDVVEVLVTNFRFSRRSSLILSATSQVRPEP